MSDVSSHQGTATHEDPHPEDLGDGPRPASTKGIGEWAVAAAVFVLGGIVLLDGLGQRQSTSASGIGAGFMPIVVGSLLLLLAVVLAVQLARGRRGEPEQAEGDVDVTRTHWTALGIAAAGLLFFLFTVEPLGFIPATTVMFYLISLAMGSRRYLMALVIALATACVIFFSFTKLLSIDLPAGFLEGMI
ncbi:tripartite tricarboxylate transporter TctB family protein [Microbacterium azadirachtae]|uniref:Tripartite tricarboxylate transporter TctB family protein n=1 Tax=Microbacterium azadirachtae TaxID=582680 RepID=A0A0F0LM24_9MICO|nr:tripartite tricarboxylate transporter TctB family protein [Microbacterium azadirachtae]KJL34183.1 Tripartite tricarboxylate transporter TctB family protein [Microbacterium azadirachtae]